DARELAVLEALFAAGLERYHVRKPRASAAELEIWIGRVPEKWRARLVLHQHHALVARRQLGGYHWRDEAGGGLSKGLFRPEAPKSELQTSRVRETRFISRSCHDLATLRASFGRYDSVFFGPVFP